MLARVRSATVFGIEAADVFVEVDVAPGLPSFTTVGLPDSAVREGRDRVRAAIRNAGLDFPVDRITVNLRADTPSTTGRPPRSKGTHGTRAGHRGEQGVRVLRPRVEGWLRGEACAVPLLAPRRVGSPVQAVN